MGLPKKQRLIDRLRSHAANRIERMDADTSEDARLVMDAAAVLQIREFDVFVHAYRRWRDRDPLPDRIEDVFARYMFAQQVPAYVRQFARDALDKASTGNLDPAAFGIAPPPPARPDPRGPVFFWGIIAFTLGFCWLVIATPFDADAQPKLFCQHGTGAGFTAMVAKSFTGKPDPFQCRRKPRGG